MSPSRLSRLVAFGVAVSAAVAVVRCTPAVFDGSVHTLGAYNVCLRRLTDACVAEDGGCHTLATMTSAVSLGDDGDGGFLWSRTGLSPLRGKRVGARFQVSTTEEKVATICNCAADVTETIRGELAVGRAPAIDCAGSVDADGGCGDDQVASLFFDGGLPDDSWLAGADTDGGSAETYGSFRATVVDDARASDGGIGCTCLPCRVVFEAQGTE